jgi:hypothetical protein
MIFSTLFIVLFFLSGLAFSTIPDAAAAKDYIGKIQKIIGGDISPALSSLLSEKENWDFLSKVRDKLNFDSDSYKIMWNFFHNLRKSSEPYYIVKIPSRIDSKLYDQYRDTLLVLAQLENFFPNCIILLETLRDMKDPQHAAQEKNDGFKRFFEEALTPVNFLTDLFEEFKKAVQVFPLDDGTEYFLLKKLKAAVDEPLATVKVPDFKPPADNTNTPPNEWSDLKKALVFGSIALNILAIISVIVFFVLRKSKSAASSS